MIQLSIYNDIELFSKIEGERKMSEAKKYVMTYEGINRKDKGCFRIWRFK